MHRSIDTRRNRIRRAGAAAFIGLLGAVTAVASCSSSNGGGPPAARQAAPACPLTPADAIGKPCTDEGLRCGPEYTCGIVTATVLCVCTRGTFSCTDSVGNPISAPPDCPGEPEAGTCPRTEATANFAACSEQGLICTYPSACPGFFDPCQCFPGTTADGGFGLRYQCAQANCISSDGAVVTIDDGGATSDGGAGVTGDARPDAPADAATTDSPPSDAAGTLPDGASPTDAPASDSSPVDDGSGLDDAAVDAAPSG